MSEIIIYISMFARLFFVSFSSTVMMFLIARAIFPQKRSGGYFFAYWVYRFFIQEILITIVLASRYKEELWFQFFYSIAPLIAFFFTFFIFWYVFEGPLLNIMIVALFEDSICGAINMIPALFIGVFEGGFYYMNLSGSFNWHDIWIPIAGGLIFYPLYRVILPHVKKFGTYEIKRPYLFWGVIAGILCYAFINNQLAIWPLNKALNTNAVIFQTASLSGVCLLVAGIVFLISYTKMLREKKRFFLENKNQMEEYYGKINWMIQQMKWQNEELDQEMNKIFQIQAHFHQEDCPDVQMEENDIAKWVENYIEILKQRYDALRPVLFCDDYAVDSVLSHFAEVCRENQIEIDFLFQEYHRKNIEEEDILRILHIFLQYGFVAANGRKKGKDIQPKVKKWIQFHVASVKNQLIFCLRSSCPQKINIRKREFCEMIKKYDGTMKISQEEGNLEIVLGLINDLYLK